MLRLQAQPSTPYMVGLNAKAAGTCRQGQFMHRQVLGFTLLTYCAINRIAPEAFCGVLALEPEESHVGNGSASIVLTRLNVSCAASTMLNTVNL